MSKKLESDDLKFLKTTANEINGLLTELSGYLNVLEGVVRNSGEESRLIPMMTDTLDRASNLATGIQEHIYRKEGHDEALDFLKPGQSQRSSGHPRTAPAPADQQQPASPPAPAKKAGPARIHPIKNSFGSRDTPKPETETEPSGVVRNFGILDSDGEPDAESVSHSEGNAPQASGQASRKYEAAGHTMSSSRQIDSALVGNKETIMVVDDEKNILLLVEMMLRSANYQMIKAQDGEEALAIFADRAEDIDLVILDFSMQGMDGQELFERMIDLKPETRILISSGYAEADALKDMLAKGLKGYIPKPYSRDRLLFQIKTALTGQ